MKYNNFRAEQKRTGKQAAYEHKCLQRALAKERMLYCQVNNLTEEEFNLSILPNTEIMEVIFQRAVAGIPNCLKTILLSNI